ncbi:MAG: transferase, partial [Acidipropionibacterium acidipropionici]|nr:transferase [Acidipropionibacterium acidipropionici]
DVELREGSLFDPVPETVDLIVSNPPYVMSPPQPKGQRLTYREAGFSGDGLIEQVVRQAPGHLNPGGTVQILANWAQIGDQPWADRLAGWVEGLGVDLWALEREHLDVHEYIETWLTDAGLDGSPQWRPRYDEWLGYFAQLGITGVSMGWITLTAAGREHPDLSFEEWPWSIEQPVGQAVGQRRAGVDDALASDDALLGGRWAVRDDVIAESTGRPGAADPEHLVFRQRSGLCRAMEADTVLGGVLGACDGDLNLGAIVAAVAEILDVDAGEVREQILPQVRRALREGILVRA